MYGVAGIGEVMREVVAAAGKKSSKLKKLLGYGAGAAALAGGAYAAHKMNPTVMKKASEAFKAHREGGGAEGKPGGVGGALKQAWGAGKKEFQALGDANKRSKTLPSDPTPEPTTKPSGEVKSGLHGNEQDEVRFNRQAVARFVDRYTKAKKLSEMSDAQLSKISRGVGLGVAGAGLGTAYGGHKLFESAKKSKSKAGKLAKQVGGATLMGLGGYGAIAGGMGAAGPKEYRKAIVNKIKADAERRGL